MANVIFYSTGEIFWVSDPPINRREHIGVPTVFPPVPPDEFFSYAQVAETLRDGGHRVVGAWGRQRREVRHLHQSAEFLGDPMFLALGEQAAAKNTVLILITTETGTPPEGVDIYPRIPFTEAEVTAFCKFRELGGGVYVTWDHGQLGYESLKALGLEGPVEPEPDEPFRPNTAHSNDSTDSPKIVVRGRRLTPKGPVEEDVALSSGPPAGYLQKIVPAQLLHRDEQTGQPAPKIPHPIFNGVGGADGIWIPAHMHEGILKVKIVQLMMDEKRLPEGVQTLAVHIPLNETSFNSFAVLAIKEAEIENQSSQHIVKNGAIIWDTSFHHLVDINWASDGKVPWESFAPFSAEGLWHQQFDKSTFDRRMMVGMKRLIVNAISWLGNEMHPFSLEQGVGTRQVFVPKIEDIPF